MKDTVVVGKNPYSLKFDGEPVDGEYSTFTIQHGYRLKVDISTYYFAAQSWTYTGIDFDKGLVREASLEQCDVVKEKIEEFLRLYADESL